MGHQSHLTKHEYAISESQAGSIAALRALPSPPTLADQAQLPDGCEPRGSCADDAEGGGCVSAGKRRELRKLRSRPLLPIFPSRKARSTMNCQSWWSSIRCLATALERSATKYLPHVTGIQSPLSSDLTEQEVYMRVMMRLCVVHQAMCPSRKHFWSNANLEQPVVELRDQSALDLTMRHQDLPLLQCTLASEVSLQDGQAFYHGGQGQGVVTWRRVHLTSRRSCMGR